MFERKQNSTFEQQVLPHLDAAYNLACWLMQNEQETGVVVQEAIVRALRCFPGSRIADARLWLMKIVRNACHARLQANGPPRDPTESNELEDLAGFGVAARQGTALQRESSARVRKAMSVLPATLREVLILRELERMTCEEIAEITGMPVDAVKSSISHAWDCLYDVFEGIVTGDVANSSARAPALEC